MKVIKKKYKIKKIKGKGYKDYKEIEQGKDILLFFKKKDPNYLNVIGKEKLVNRNTN